MKTLAQNVSSSRPKIEEAIKTTKKSAIHLLILLQICLISLTFDVNIAEFLSNIDSNVYLLKA